VFSGESQIQTGSAKKDVKGKKKAEDRSLDVRDHSALLPAIHALFYFILPAQMINYG